MRQELQPALALATTLAPAELPKLIGELAEISAVASARLASPAIEREDSLLSVEQAAARMHVSENYLYRNSKRLPFVRRIGRKVLFSSSGLDKFLARR